MSVCEFIVAIVGVTAGNINPVTQAVNTKAQKVLVTFVMMYVLLLFNFVISGSLTLGSFFSVSFHRYICFFSASWGPVVWVITGEIFVGFLPLSSTYYLFHNFFLKPLAIRAKGMSLSVASNWLWNFGIGYATPYLEIGRAHV